MSLASGPDPQRLVAYCPAKVNLSLRVLGRRADGYHELDTVFQAVDLWDRLEARLAERFSMACDDPRLPLDDTNLVIRAAKLLHDLHAPEAPGASFDLNKAIPVEGGMAGGSSDAAAALLACRRLWEVPVDDSELARLGAQLGADVPFFLVGGTARGTGRGDLVESLPFAGPMPMLLGCPPFGVSTPEVFASLPERLTLPVNSVSVSDFSARKWPGKKDFGAPQPFREAVGWGNDLEQVVLERWPELGEFRDALSELGASVAMVSGSGSTVFGVFSGSSDLASRERAEAADELQARFERWRVLSTRAVCGAAHLADPEQG